MTAEDASRAIVQIAIAKMSLAVREVSVEKGYDPRDFVLVASGGGGPPHAVASAASVRIEVSVAGETTTPASPTIGTTSGVACTPVAGSRIVVAEDDVLLR